MRFFQLIFQFCFMLCLLVTKPSDAARFAVLVGNSNGGPDVQELRYVKNDLQSLGIILKEHCGFDNGHILLLRDKTPRDLEAILSELKSKLPATEDNLLLFYYSGHADQSNLKMGNEKYPLQSLKDSFSAFPVSIRIGVFDACQSGSFTRLKGGVLSEPFLFKEDSKIKGQVILSSSSATENAQESDLYKSSVFTFHFVNALRGSADMSGDRKVTLAEAYQYSYNHTVSSTAATWGGTQHPGYQFQIQGEGDIVLADLNIRTLGILLQNGLSGSITINDEKGNVVADLDKEPLSTVMIALNPGKYSIYKNEVGRMWKSTAVVTSSAVQIGVNDFVETKVQQSRKKGVEPRYTSINIGFSGGCRRLVMKSLNSQTQEQFNGYSMFGVNPVFNFPYESFSFGIMGELSIRSQYLVTLSYEKSHWKEDQSFTGKVNVGGNNTGGGVSLQLNRSLDLTTFDIGTGYRFYRGVLKGVSGTAGLSFVSGSYTIKTEFFDTLFDVGGNKEFVDDGMKVLPFIAVAYKYQILPFIALGVQARFRYQDKPGSYFSGFGWNDVSEETGSIDDKEEFKYTFRGVELHANLLFTFKIREIEE